MFSLFFIILFIQFSVSFNELVYTTYDGSYQLYSFNKCYQNETQLTSFILFQNNTQIVYSDNSCNNYLSSNEFDPYNNGFYHSLGLTQNNIFAQLIFSPKEIGCSFKNFYSKKSSLSPRLYSTKINNKCQNGDIDSLPYSFKTSLEREDDYFIKRSRYFGYNCENNPIETLYIKCNTCQFYSCEYNTWISALCDETVISAAPSLLILCIILIILFLI